MLNFLFSFFSQDLAIDLGTANTLIFIKGKGIAIRQPSFVAKHKKTKKIIAFGAEAKKMQGKTPQQIIAFRPLKDGVIADFDATAAMLKHYIQKASFQPNRRFFPFRPRVVIGIPSGVTEVERRAVWEAALSAGAREAFLVEEPMAAAIGAGLPIEESKGSSIVDIGGGTTEMAIISLSGIVHSLCLRTAGDEMDEAIVNFLRLKYSLLIGPATAEEIKISVGSAYPEGEEKQTVVRGRSLETGLPKTIKLRESEIREALSPILNEIIESLRNIIEDTPPELMGDIMEQGVALSGGGANLMGIDKKIAKELKIPVWVVEKPEEAVVRGAAKLLENDALLDKIKIIGGLK